MQLTPGLHFMIHPHYKNKHNQPGMTLLAEIHCLAQYPKTLEPLSATHCTEEPHDTAAWSEAFPIAGVGNLLSPDEFQIAIALRTDAKIFEPRNAAVVRLLIGWCSMASPALRPRAAFPDTHPSTPFSKGHRPALVSPLSWSPLLTNDRRRPDGLTLNPWYKGRSLTLDTTVVNTFAPSHYIVSSAKPGSVATDAETGKCQKYNDLLGNYYFQPAAIKTTGVYSKSTVPFFSCLASKLVDVTGDPRERQWLHQRLSTGLPDA